MSLSERTQRVDAWRRTKPTSISVDVPMWLVVRVNTAGLVGEQEEDGDDDWSTVLLQIN